jgi:hypothetical protein
MKRAVKLIAAALMALSLAALGWGLWPVRYAEHSLVYDAPPAGKLPAGEYAIRGRWPTYLRVGDVGRLELSLAQRSAPPGVIGRARLELPGLAHTPPGESSQPLSSHQAALFEYRAQPGLAGQFTGTLWLHRVWVGSADPVQPLAAIPIAIQAGAFLGLSGPWARALGAAGVVIGLGLFFLFPASPGKPHA